MVPAAEPSLTGRPRLVTDAAASGERASTSERGTKVFDAASVSERRAVTESTFDDFDHESHMQAALEQARSAMERGDRPFGSVLVRDDAVVMAESNRVVTESDLRRHPELHLAYRAHREYTADERAAMVMYTSTEPCPMCAGGLRTVGLGRVVYSVGADEKSQYTGGEPAVRSADVLTGVTEVVGPVLNEAGHRIHGEYGWE